MTVVAHSMGGLVAREFINIQHSHKTPLVDSFISISTPWNGHATAASGVKYAPVVIPVWRDMVPGSPFLKKLVADPLQNIPHYLLFGFKGSSKVAGQTSDGVVTIRSQLRPVTQEQAQLVRGFDEDHVSILENTDVSALINRILKENL
jgi:pimeloyl-ACP methyl ester carboxylesterase